jgi:hypothetical protein
MRDVVSKLVMTRLGWEGRVWMLIYSVLFDQTVENDIEIQTY